jgi:hypothetical protein
MVKIIALFVLGCLDMIRGLWTTLMGEVMFIGSTSIESCLVAMSG